jgi:hypothetical protein
MKNGALPPRRRIKSMEKYWQVKWAKKVKKMLLIWRYTRRM